MNVHLELTRRCLLACPKCPRTIMRGQYDICDLSLNHIEQACKLNPKMIYLLGNYGDPIYHPQMHEIIMIMQHYNQSFSLHTAGTGRKLDWWHDIYDSYDNTNSKFVFVVDGIEHSAPIYRVGINWSETFGAMSLGASLGKNIEWEYIIMKHNEDDVKQAQIMAREHGIKFKLQYSQKWDGDNDPYKPQMTYEQYKSFLTA